MKTNVISAARKITGSMPEPKTGHRINDDLSRVTADDSLLEAGFGCRGAVPGGIDRRRAGFAVNRTTGTRGRRPGVNQDSG